MLVARRTPAPGQNSLFADEQLLAVALEEQQNKGRPAGRLSPEQRPIVEPAGETGGKKKGLAHEQPKHDRRLAAKLSAKATATVGTDWRTGGLFDPESRSDGERHPANDGAAQSQIPEDVGVAGQHGSGGHRQPDLPAGHRRNGGRSGRNVGTGQRSRKQTATPTHQPSLFAAADVEPLKTQPSASRDTPATIAVQTPRFRLESIEIPSGLKAKAEATLAALRLLKTLEDESRIATDEEKKILACFTGFGAIANHIFPEPGTNNYKDGWAALGEELASLLSAEEYDSAKRSTFNAFYTSKTVMQGIYDALNHMGVEGEGIRVMEPGCGIGNFIGMAPSDMQFVGIEMETLSGRIARQIYPDADIRIENFRHTHLPEGSMDVVVGNVPFADLKLRYDGTPLALHDYFFAKSLDSVRDGGVMALVTSRFTMDKRDSRFRERLSEQADFLGTMRLPSNAFKQEGTQVVTDIIFLRKRGKEEPAQHAGNWLETELLVDGQEGTRHNSYFADHPEMVCGSLTEGRGMYQNHELMVDAPTHGIAAALDTAITHLPPNSYQPGTAAERFALPRLRTSTSPMPQAERKLSAGAFLIGDDGYICQVVNNAGTVRPVLHGQNHIHALTGSTGQKLADLIALRDSARQVLWTQNEQREGWEREEARDMLNHRYDRFVQKWGPINKTTITTTKTGSTVRRMPNIEKFRDDPDAYLVMALEKYNEKDGTATKMDIMRQDVIGPTPTVQQVSNALDGLLVSLNERGRVDIETISQLYGKPEAEVIRELGTRIFYDPALASYVTAEEYLSGNVREKLRLAQAQTAGGPETGEGEGPDLRPNVVALQDAQPDDVSPADIDPNLGAPWIPADIIRTFIAELLEAPPSMVQVRHVGKEALWRVNADTAVSNSIHAISTYGTLDRNAIDLINDALNMRVPTVYDIIKDSDGEKRVINQTATLGAREKQTAIKEQFRNWVFADPERTDVLVRKYNDTFNTMRLRSYDGAHLSFPGMNPAITLHDHQTDAVWRTMSGGNTLLAHVVGAGKTFEMIASGMKMKQTGLVRKPLYVVPNHMLEQFATEFYSLYPNANILVASKDDLKKEKRQLFTAKIASGEWDGVIMTHSSFGKIGMSPAFQRSFVRQQIQDYERLLTDMKNNDFDEDTASKRLIKQIEKKKAVWEDKLEMLMNASSKDVGLTFEDLGVDQLFIDEAHLFKNLETPTKMDRVAGVQTQGSQRAFDLLMKGRYIEAQTPGRGVCFATGTPISNSMVEMYTMQRFLAPGLMAERDIGHFDAWAAVFGDVVDSIELSPDGKSLRTNRRFARFVNLPELLQMFHSFADVKTAEMLDLPRPALKGGKVQTIACPMSEEQQAIQETLVQRYERVRDGGVEPRVDNALKITTDGRKLALDARLVNPDMDAFEGSKVNALVDQVQRIWEDTGETRSTQMIFCDMGVSDKNGHSVYHDIIRQLQERGIPPAEIANIGDYNTDKKKEQLFEQVRSGDVRVLLGSTAKMGVGTNVQERLIALHHLDAPWKPAEVEQREGRILRQGNTNKEVEIYRYVTEGSFDAYMWQTLETKASFIAQVMTGDATIRRMEDLDSQALSYAEVKAIASGNPAMLTLSEDGHGMRASGTVGSERIRMMPISSGAASSP